MNTAIIIWLIIWFLIALGIVIYLGYNVYKEKKTKEKNINLNNLTKQSEIEYDKLEKIDIEILDLLNGYEKNDISFNFISLVRLLKEYKFDYKIISTHGNKFEFRINLNHRSVTLNLMKVNNDINVMIYHMEACAKG